MHLTFRGIASQSTIVLFAPAVAISLLATPPLTPTLP